MTPEDEIAVLKADRENLHQRVRDLTLQLSTEREITANLTWTIEQLQGDGGWKEAVIAWSVCASIHREYAKGKDPLFKTRQADFVRHEGAARAALPSTNRGPDG